jgi:hypothetical protein
MLKCRSQYDITYITLFIVIICVILSLLMNIYIFRKMKELQYEMWTTQSLVRTTTLDLKLDHKHCYSQERTNETTEQADILRP